MCKTEIVLPGKTVVNYDRRKSADVVTVCVGRRSGWMLGSTKHQTLKQEMAVRFPFPYAKFLLTMIVP